jgi:polyisoprenoid-binding protein YceI
MTSGTVTKSGTSYTIKTNGMLNIAGTSKALSLTTTATLNSDQSISVKGSTKFDMSSYGVTPPTVMMGTIKTGDAITIEYNGKLTK